MNIAKKLINKQVRFIIAEKTGIKLNDLWLFSTGSKINDSDKLKIQECFENNRKLFRGLK